MPVSEVTAGDDRFRRVALFVALWALAAACGRGGAEPRHLLLVTVDTLRADRIGSYGHPLDLTPNIDALARRSARFTAAYAPAPFTLPSVVALLTGTYPQRLGVLSNRGRLPEDEPTLATHLRGRGWQTGAVVSNYILREEAGLYRDFHEYDATYPGMEAHREIPERIAEDTTEAALAMLARLRRDGDRPFFLWIHYQDPHGPYMPDWERRARYLAFERKAPGGTRKLSASSNDMGMGNIPRYQFDQGMFEVAFYRAGYDAEINYMDEHVGRLISSLDEMDLLDETVIVFAADHGEGLGENNYWFAHGEYLSEEQLRVPLLFAVPGRPAEERHDLASLVDLVPTLCALFGVPLEGDFPGRDLLAEDARNNPSTAYFFTMPDASTVTRYGMAKDGFRYVVSGGGKGPRQRLFRLGADPQDRLAEFADLARSMRAELNAFRDRMTPKRRPELQALTPEERKRLKSLGYVAD